MGRSDGLITIQSSLSRVKNKLLKEEIEKFEAKVERVVSLTDDYDKKFEALKQIIKSTDKKWSEIILLFEDVRDE